jgi:hypothetical protein
VTEPVQKTGFLAKPEFLRGGLPPIAQYLHEKPKPSRWAAHFELGRQFPVWPNGRKPPPGYQVDPDRGWMIVSRVTRGGKATTLKAINYDRWDINRRLDSEFPLERWQTAQRTIPDTWAQRELYLRFLGTLTEEEDALDRKERRERHEARQVLINENRAKKALAARLAARAEMEANQAKGRSRG